MSGPVRSVEERGGAWLRLVLDRPRANLLSLEMVRAVAAALDAARATRRKWLTFEGAGDDFSFGAVIQEHVPGAMETVLPETHAMIRAVLQYPAATAALVQGRCLGGGFELALACDTIVATDGATLGLPEIQLGVFPPAGAALLPLRIGASRAASAVLTGAARPASWWREAGLVDEIVSRGALLEAAARWFDAHLAPRSASAIEHAAAASRLTLRAQAEPAIAAAERLYLDKVLKTHDAGEGVRAFIEKRTPQWKDR
jgi:cyclohexa-1,5-dienecarbonyl-CoA hydratase